MAEEKQLPTVEYSLKSMSWHLKCIVEEIKGLRQDLNQARSSQSKEECPF